MISFIGPSRLLLRPGTRIISPHQEFKIQYSNAVFLLIDIAFIRSWDSTHFHYPSF